jgi:hypothetical protein
MTPEETTSPRCRSSAGSSGKSAQEKLLGRLATVRLDLTGISLQTTSAGTFFRGGAKHIKRTSVSGKYAEG